MDSKGISSAQLEHVEMESPVIHPRGAIRKQEHVQGQSFKEGKAVKL